MKFFNLAHSLLFCFLFSLSLAFGQGTTITGNVYDGTTGLPLSNFSVTSSVAGTTPVATNANGAYSLFVPSGSDFLVIINAQNGKCYREKWTWGRKVLDFHLTACNYDRSRDSIALRSLYDNLSGAAWTNPWNLNDTIGSWQNIVINTQGGGPVKFVGLDNRNLNGTFPTGSTGFSNLRDIFGFQFVGNTNLRGTLPSLTNMKQLDWVKIQESGMSGDPLSSIAGLKNIEFLRLTFNTSMSTTFPATISADWRNMYNLQLESVNLSGTIPTALFALPNLQTVGLGQNKLTGTVPSLASGNSSTIKFLILNDNDLDSVPNLSVSTNLTALGVKGNKLTFDDIVPNISKFNAATVYEGSANSFVYAPQDSFFVDTTYRKVVGDPLSIDLKIDGALTSNTYTWNRNGVFFRTTTTNKLTFASLVATDAGIYTCTVTNTNAPLLTLVSRRITIQVNPATNTCRSRDSLALVDLYNATGGANWTNKWILAQPMTTWYGVTLSTQGCVEQLNLFNNNLTGSSGIPNLNLQNLKILRLQDNNIRGAIPSFTNMTLLDTVHFGGNRFTSLGNQTMMPNLTHLDLSRNTISGSMPTLNLPKLKDLFLGVNQFSGALPNYQNLPALVKYHAQSNNLSGVIPVLTAMPNIRELQLEENAFDSLQRPPQASPAISVVWLKGNSLSFDDLLPYPTSNLTSLTGWTYAPQDSFFVDTTINTIVGAPLSIDLKIDGAITTSQYKWSKDGTFSRTFLRNKLVFSSLQPIDTGVWTCQVTNSAAPLLTLQSRKITIKINCAASATNQTLNPTICPSQTYRSPSGKIFSTAGTKFDTLKNQNGCDSVAFTINLKIQTPQYPQAAGQSVCKNGVYRGIILTRDTAFIDTLRSVGLCDSVITTTPIKVNNASVNNLNLSLCVGSSVTVNGIVYNAAKRTGQQILTAASTTGCDSIINISTTFVSNLSAIDDDFTIIDSNNTLIFNVLTNDVFSGIVKTTPLSKPGTGRLDTLGAGRFTYSVPPQAIGTTSFNYRLCSVGCPNVCDTATVKIAIMRPRLNTDISIGITPNCSCPNEKLLFPELELNPDKFPNNELVIISRWGDVVYRAKPYKNDWTGANENNENLPAGTYYYIMRLDLANSNIKTGDVTIYR